MRLTPIFTLLGLVALALTFSACDQIIPNSNGDLVDYSCEGCHTSKGTLEDIIDELDLDPPDEGHAAPG